MRFRRSGSLLLCTQTAPVPGAAVLLESSRDSYHQFPVGTLHTEPIRTDFLFLLLAQIILSCESGNRARKRLGLSLWLEANSLLNALSKLTRRGFAIIECLVDFQHSASFAPNAPVRIGVSFNQGSDVFALRYPRDRQLFTKDISVNFIHRKTLSKL